MTSPKPKLPEIPEAELTPLVQQLLGIILRQQEQIEELQEEIRRLKGHKGKPPIKPSRMDQEAQGDGEEAADKERKRGPKRSKTAQLQVVDEVIAPEGLPTNAREQGWRFKGYADYVVQELVIEVRNIRYRLEEWQGPEGQWLRGKLPASVNGNSRARVGELRGSPAPSSARDPAVVVGAIARIRDRNLGRPVESPADRGAGSLSRREGHGAGSGASQVSHYLQTDDTGARHGGKNGYCTYIGNEFFAWFESTQSKSRVNFLSLLRAGHTRLCAQRRGTGIHGRAQAAPRSKLNLLQEGRSFEDQQAWEGYLKSVGISAPRHRLIATEGALVGSLLARGFPVAMGIASRRCRAVQRVPPCPVLDPCRAQHQ
jgi:hypothetical protein